MNKWICCTSWCFWIPLTLSWIARCIAVPDFAIHLWYYTTDILTFVIRTMSSSWDMIQCWSHTKLGRKYVNLDTLSLLQGVVDGHNRLSGDLQHNGATADQGMQIAAEVLDNKQHCYKAVDIQYQAMEQELERYRTVTADSMARMKARNKAAMDSMQAQLEAQEKSLAEFRQKQAEEEARNQEARQQASRQPVSPDQSLSWDYRISSLRAQQVQLLPEQEAMASHHPSSAIEELTSPEAPGRGGSGRSSCRGDEVPWEHWYHNNRGPADALTPPDFTSTVPPDFTSTVLWVCGQPAWGADERAQDFWGLDEIPVDQKQWRPGSRPGTGVATFCFARAVLPVGGKPTWGVIERVGSETQVGGKPTWGDDERDDSETQVFLGLNEVSVGRRGQGHHCYQAQAEWCTQGTAGPGYWIANDQTDFVACTIAQLGLPGRGLASTTWSAVDHTGDLRLAAHQHSSGGMDSLGAPDRGGYGRSFCRGTSFHHQEELTELGQDAQSLLISLDWNHQYRNWDAFSSAEQTPLRHPMQGVSAGVTEPQDSVFQLEAVLQKCHVDRDLQGVSAGTIAPQSSIIQHQEAVPSSAHHHEEHSVDDLVVCHPEPDMVTGGQTNLRSSTDAIVELESGGTDDPDPVMDSGAYVASPTKATSPPEVARELATHPQSLSKDTSENFTAEQVGDFRPHYQRSSRLLRKKNASRQDRKQAKKEFSTQPAGQSGSDDSSGSSSDDHYRRGQRKGRKHQKGSRPPRRATGTSDASLDRNWQQKDNRHTLKVSKLSSCDYSGRQNGWDFDMEHRLQDTEHVKVTVTGSEEFWWDASKDFEEELMDSLKRESCEQVSTTIKDKAIQQEYLLAE